MTDLLKAILLAIAAVVGPVLYRLLTGVAPNIPITEETFMALLVYLISALFGGAAAQLVTQFAISYMEFGPQHKKAKALLAFVAYIASLGLVLGIIQLTN
jgi:H+/Cl- antiporter ClcA